MQKRVFEWQGQEFVGLSDEARSGGSPFDQTRDVLERMDLELRKEETTLLGTVRTRLWARDAGARNRGSRARVEVLSGGARSASSSYIAPDHLKTSADIAIDLVAMKPAKGLQKTLVEYDPPIVPLRYLVYGPLVHLSGVTSVKATLAEQAAEVLQAISGSLEHAGTSWDKVVKVSFHLLRGESQAEMERLFGNRAPNAEIDYALVDGYSTPDKRVEIEVTAAVE